jgi:hypothetical protein
MTVRILFAAILAMLCNNASPAQDVSGRIDLDAIAPVHRVVMARLVFSKTAAVSCPQDFGILRISPAGIWHHRPLLPGRPAVASGFISNLPNDETHLFRVATPDCRFDIAVRQQILQDDNWVSLLVTKRRRPSLSADERRELDRQFLAQLKDRAKSRTPEESARLRKAAEALNSIGSLMQGALMLGTRGAFDDAPATCFEAIGSYVIDPEGVTFLFATGLPGDLNRFVIDRTDIDDERSRLHLTQGDCRFELTISKSARSDGRWQAVAVVPFVKANEPKARIQIRRKEAGEQPQ